MSACPRSAKVLLLALVAACSGALAHAGELRVNFIEPEKFTDARLHAYSGADPLVISTIDQHLQKLAGPCLGPDQSLQIEILDIDLAGSRDRMRRHGSSSLRVMREIDWPSMKLAWVLRSRAGESTQESERISDMEYLLNSGFVRGDSQPLPYERVMLTNWFQKRFCNTSP